MVSILAKALSVFSLSYISRLAPFRFFLSGSTFDIVTSFFFLFITFTSLALFSIFSICTFEELDLTSISPFDLTSNNSFYGNIYCF